MSIDKIIKEQLYQAENNIKSDLENLPIPRITIRVFSEDDTLYMQVVCKNEEYAAQWKQVLNEHCDKVDVYYGDDGFGDRVVKVLGSVY